MLPGPLLKAEPLVVIIKDGGSVDLQEALWWQRVGGDMAQETSRNTKVGLDWIVTSTFSMEFKKNLYISRN